MAKALIGKAPLTVVRMTDGRRANIPAGVLVPGSVDPDDAERLFLEGYLDVIDIVEPEDESDDVDEGPDGNPVAPGDPGDPPLTEQPAGDPGSSTAGTEVAPGGDEDDEDDDLEEVAAYAAAIAEIRENSIPVVLEKVGDNAELAAAVLELERAQDEPRKTLVDALEPIAAEGDE